MARNPFWALMKNIRNIEEFTPLLDKIRSLRWLALSLSWILHFRVRHVLAIKVRAVLWNAGLTGWSILPYR